MLDMQLPTRTWGSSDGPRILLVHGLSSDSTTWWRVAAHLAGLGWSVTAVDLRGHGEAPRGDRWALADYAGDLPTGPWDAVVGHSLGAASAILAAHHIGAARLVLLDPVLRVAPDSGVREAQAAELAMTEEVLRTERAHWHDEDIASKMRGIELTDAEVVDRTFVDSDPWDIVDALRALPMPVTILRGDPAVFTMVTDDELADAGKPVRVIEGAGHAPHRDRPDETLDAIVAALGT